MRKSRWQHHFSNAGQNPTASNLQNRCVRVTDLQIRGLRHEAIGRSIGEGSSKPNSMATLNTPLLALRKPVHEHQGNPLGQANGGMK